MRLQAQVTIGSEDLPKDFSVIELISNNSGLRLPQLSIEDHNSLNFETLKPANAEGLVIYNTDEHCLEFWNGSEWISMCETHVDYDEFKFPYVGDFYELCTTSTIADLIIATGGRTQFYDDPEGGRSDCKNYTFDSRQNLLYRASICLLYTSGTSQGGLR